MGIPMVPLNDDEMARIIEIQNMRRIDYPSDIGQPLIDRVADTIPITLPIKTNHGECWYCGTTRATIYHGIMCNECYKAMYGEELCIS